MTLADQTAVLEAALLSEHARLVQLCAYLSHDPEAAEDLAQETLVEAWNNVHKLYDPRSCAAWLRAIARNVCRRWQSTRRHTSVRLHDPLDGVALINDRPDSLTIELEHAELVHLLDRALALLPAQTRTLLIEHYMRDVPHAEIAARLGVSEGAVRVQAHRGKLALRRVLTTHFRDELGAYVPLANAAVPDQETRIWCMGCGQRQLVTCHDPGSGAVDYTCPACVAHIGISRRMAEDIVGATGRRLTSHKVLLSRAATQLHRVYCHAMVTSTLVCPTCGRHMPLQTGAVAWNGRYGLAGYCATCDRSYDMDLGGIVFSLPETQQFWRKHPRMWCPPGREVDYSGRTAAVISYKSVLEPTSIDVIVARGSCEVLHIQEVATS